MAGRANAAEALVCEKTCEVQVEDCEKRRLTRATVCRKNVKKAGELMLPKHPCVRKLQEANAAKGDYKREDCEIQMGVKCRWGDCEKRRLTQALATVQENCKMGGRRASAAETPVHEKTARGECCQKRRCSRRLRKTNACEMQVGRLWDDAESDHMRRQMPQAAMCEKVAEGARAATDNCVQEERANSARAASCGEVNVAESDHVQKTASKANAGKSDCVRRKLYARRLQKGEYYRKRPCANDCEANAGKATVCNESCHKQPCAR